LVIGHYVISHCAVIYQDAGIMANMGFYCVGMYVQGCTRRPEALIGAILELQKKIEGEKLIGA